MKIIIKINLLLICTFIVNVLIAQDYKKKPELDKYVGTWIWESGNDKFEIKITKQKLLSKNLQNQNYYWDIIVGWHKYTQNGQVIENSMGVNSTKTYTTWNDAWNNCTIIGGTRMGDYNKISMFFQDITRDKRGEAILEVIPGEANKLRWKLRGRGVGVYIGDEPSPPPGWSVPTELILTKKVSNLPPPLDPGKPGGPKPKPTD